jgi:putative hydrolase of the HAD superfamily
MDVAAVGFDLDDTLAVPARDRQTLLDEATAAAGVRDIDREEYLAAHGADVATQDRTPIFERILEDADPEPVARAYREAVNDALVAVPGAAALVRELRGSYRVGLLTDGPTRAQRSKLARLGWEELFDTVVVTGELPAGKPDGRAFEALSESLGVPPAETVYVGDDPVADVGGASAAGMLAVQVRAADGPAPDPRADGVVDRENLAAGLREFLTDRR